MDVPRMKTRDIGRSAIREELARVALGLFSRESFEAVTLDDLAASAGVSRSTFLRYFGSKEEVVLFTFDPLGDQMAEALRARPADEDHWTALRRAVEPAVAFLSREPAEGSRCSTWCSGLRRCAPVFTRSRPAGASAWWRP
ncbi:TetR/AcrR family transcriptional regulator [Streptomyces malaysiensis]|uniref:TetR/AcrR family transcriptional regulator n=1 Tax=Streptomyces sp. HNM0561 TaxID=2903099 RepID=UPI001E4AD834|nr:TetR/AcrR family transcriptional regulator [Streptomyces sp. HNM0561]UHH16380.1 TetR/AcrR family transcriptional regulator [Streptomyces sp. HNM0561]